MERAWVLPFAAGADVAIAIGYAAAGALLLRRMRASHERRAGTFFALWWFGISATALVTLLLHALALRGASPMTLDLVDQLSLATYALALSGLVSYVAFIYTGSHRLATWIFATYAALVAWSVAAALASPATSFMLEGWQREVVRPPDFGPPRVVTAALLSAPALAAIVAYASLLRQAASPETRGRIALVTGALLAWLAGSALASVPALQPVVAAQLGSRAVILASAGLMVAAYRPPGLLRSWWGDPDAREAHERMTAMLEQRVRELV